MPKSKLGRNPLDRKTSKSASVKVEATQVRIEVSPIKSVDKIKSMQIQVDWSELINTAVVPNAQKILNVINSRLRRS